MTHTPTYPPRFPDRIGIAPLTLQRWDGAFASATVSAITSSFEELRVWLPWATSIPDISAERAALIEGGRRFGRNEDWPFLVLEQQDVVGSAGLHRRGEPSVLEIGYWIRTDRTGRGYATSVARALTSAAFQLIPELERVEIVTHRENLASQTVARKLDFTLWREETRDPGGSALPGQFRVWSMDRPRWPTVA